MPAYDVTYIDKKLKTQVTKRVYSRQVAAALRRASRADWKVVWNYVGGTTITVTRANLRYKQNYPTLLSGAPKPDETQQRWDGEHPALCRDLRDLGDTISEEPEAQDG